MPPLIRPAALAVALAAGLSGCATLAPSADNQRINQLLADRQGPAIAWSDVGQPPAERQAISAWLSEPMTADAAVRVAMLRSPRLQVEYARLGLARAEVLDAVEIGNPTLSLARESVDPGNGVNRIAGLSLPLADLLVLPMRTRLARAEFERAQLDIAGAVLAVAADVEAAWYSYVGARQVADMRTAVAEGAEASAELAQRFFDAGNISELQLSQEQAAASEARIAAAQARAEAGRRRLELVSLVGLSGDDANWQASDRLPLPVANEDDPAQLAELADQSNLELQSARQQARILADALGITRKLRWLGGTEIGYSRERDGSGERLHGPSIDLELPIFNQGQAKLARAEALLAEARARVEIAELTALSGVRLNAQAVRELRNVVDIHRTGLIPQRERVVARSQQEQNFMLIGVFELIQAKVKEYDAYQGYLEAVRDYWLARVELMRAVGQRLPSEAGVSARTPSVQEILTPSAPPMDHSMHGAKPGAAPMDHSMHGAKPAAAPMDHSMHDAKPDAAPMDHSMHGAKPAAAPMDHSMHDAKPDASPPPGDGDEPEASEPAIDDHAHHHGATP